MAAANSLSQSLLRQGVALACPVPFGKTLCPVSQSLLRQGVALGLSDGVVIAWDSGLNPLLRQGVALASMCPSDEAYSYVSIPSSSGRGLGPTTEGNETWPFVSIPSSSGRGLGPVAVCGNPRVRQGLNPFFVRAWPWPGYARHSRRVGRLNPFFVRAWPWPPTPRGACSRPIPVSIPSSSGRGLGR